jgi:hypothetical protein
VNIEYIVKNQNRRRASRITKVLAGQLKAWTHKKLTENNRKKSATLSTLFKNGVSRGNNKGTPFGSCDRLAIVVTR